MKILCTDLDNTLIYSYKHDIGIQKRNVEIYQGREISYITDKTYDLLKKVKKEYLIIPTSTRTEEQYKRIDLGIGKFRYALVCNGGVLLVNGCRDLEWYEESKKLIQTSTEEINRSLAYLEKDNRRKFELRFIEDLFVFTKCEYPLEVVNDLKTYLNNELVDIFSNGEKVYVVPAMLSKGNAVKRLRKYLGFDKIVAAGDSEFDVSMVQEADIGIVPFGFKEKYKIKSDISEMAKNKIFSEAVLEKCLSLWLHIFKEMFSSIKLEIRGLRINYIDWRKNPENTNANYGQN